MSSRWTGFFVWALVAATAVFWGLRIFAATRPLPVEARLPARLLASNTPMTRLFGALPQADEPAAAPAESERFTLQGVIAEGSDGIALVSIDGQPPKPWRVGAAVEGDTMLLGVTRRGAQFGPRGGPASFTLELPLPVAAATGTLPNAMAQSPNASPVPVQGFSPGAAPGMVRPAPGAMRLPNGQPMIQPRTLQAIPQQQQPQQPAQDQSTGRGDEE